jgi:hypothetical protein
MLSSWLFETFRNTALLTTPAVVSSIGCRLSSFTLINANTVPVYVKFYNAAAPTVGTTTPLAVIPIPAGDGVNPGIHIVPVNGFIRDFNTALAIAPVTGLADNSTAAPSTGIYCELIYE